MNGKLVAASLSVSMFMWTAPALAGMPQSDVKPSQDVAWLIIGVQPANTRLEVDEPYFKNGVAWGFHYSMDSYTPVDGFIVVKAHPGAVYGIAASSRMAGKSIFGMRYKPCGQVPKLEAAAGKVVYFTSVDYHSEGGGSTGVGLEFFEGATYSQDLEGARAFLKAHYPGLSDSLEQGPTEMLPIARKCRAR